MNQLINQYAKINLQISTLLANMGKNNNLFLHVDLQINKNIDNNNYNKNQNIFLSSINNKKIKIKQNILLLNGLCGFISNQFIGASHKENQLSNNNSNIFNDNQFIKKIKICLQVLAQLKQISIQSKQHFHQYAQILFQQNYGAFQDISKINSSYIGSLVESSRNQLEVVYSALEQSFMKGVQFDQFTQVYNAVKRKIRPFNSGEVGVFPLIDVLHHSFTPNCQINGIYMAHRRSSFVCLNAIRQIHLGQKLTINYGNMSNNQLYFKYGVTIPNNPYNQFYVILNYNNIIQIFNNNILWKQIMLKKYKQKLRSFIRINIKGKIIDEDLLMLKILFQKYEQNLSNEQMEIKMHQNQLQIYQFVRYYAKKIPQTIISKNNTELQDKHLKQLILDEIQLKKQLFHK